MDCIPVGILAEYIAVRRLAIIRIRVDQVPGRQQPVLHRLCEPRSLRLRVGAGPDVQAMLDQALDRVAVLVLHWLPRVWIHDRRAPDAKPELTRVC